MPYSDLAWDTSLWAVGLRAGPLIYLELGTSSRRAPMKGGNVIAVDQKTRSLICRLHTGGDWTCETTSKTIFAVGKTKGSWSDIKKGVTVECIFHHEGQAAVADRIQIESQAAQPLKD